HHHARDVRKQRPCTGDLHLEPPFDARIIGGAPGGVKKSAFGMPDPREEAQSRRSDGIQEGSTVQLSAVPCTSVQAHRLRPGKAVSVVIAMAAARRPLLKGAPLLTP